MEKPLVSVIVPAYNHERFICECINSIRNQTYKKIQLVVIDDASTDSTAYLIKELANKFNFQFHINDKNQGHVKVINYALKTLVKGKYLCILASDDYFPLDKLEQQVEIMENDQNIAVCSGNAVCIDENSRPILPVSKSLFFDERQISFEELLMGNTIPALTCMIRKDIYDKIGYYNEEIITEDWYCWLRILNEGGKIFHFNKIWGYYRVLQTSLSKRNDERLYQAQLKVIEEYKHNPLFKKAADNLCKKFCLKKSLDLINDGKKLSAMRYLLKRKLFDKVFFYTLKKIILN